MTFDYGRREHSVLFNYQYYTMNYMTVEIWSTIDTEV